MTFNSKVNADFGHYLESMVNLNALDRMTMELDNELQDSQKVMNEIKGMINTLPNNADNIKSEPHTGGLRHEDISSFLSAGTPTLLMPDMVDNSVDVDLDIVIATMNSYAEDLKKTLTQAESQSQPRVPRDIESLDLESYASSLEQLTKRIATLKLNKRDGTNQRNVQLEAKLSLLCDDVNIFTRMVQAKTTLSEANKKWSPTQQHSTALSYDNLINRLLSGINEVSYLLQNKN